MLKLKDPLQQKHTMQCIIEFSLFVCFHGGPNFQKQDFSCSGGPKWDPPVTFELEIREQNQLSFWNISIRPTSGASFTQIGRPTFSTSGTLSQTMTLKRRLILMLNYQLDFVNQNIFTFYFSKHGLSFPAQYSIRTLLAAVRKLKLKKGEFYSNLTLSKK